MKVERTELPEVWLLEPKVFSDARGSLYESYSAERYAQAGLSLPFVQDNCVRSFKNAVRGLHFQHPEGQGKLVSVLVGNVLDVVVDIRRGSPTFGKHISVELTSELPRQLWIPPGFAHGFCVLSDEAVVFYKCTRAYAPKFEHALRWNDPALNIRWPVATPILSAKDQEASPLAELENLPVHGRD
jgi:dTDP-4-dehydrorhamnose 3,5-epimerase